MFLKNKLTSMVNLNIDKKENIMSVSAENPKCIFVVSKEGSLWRYYTESLNKVIDRPAC